MLPQYQVHRAFEFGIVENIHVIFISCFFLLNVHRAFEFGIVENPKALLIAPLELNWQVHRRVISFWTYQAKSP